MSDDGRPCLSAAEILVILTRLAYDHPEATLRELYAVARQSLTICPACAIWLAGMAYDVAHAERN